MANPSVDELEAIASELESAGLVDDAADFRRMAEAARKGERVGIVLDLSEQISK